MLYSVNLKGHYATFWLQLIKFNLASNNCVCVYWTKQNKEKQCNWPKQ